MDTLPPPLRFFLLLFSGWVHRRQASVIEYLLEENRLLSEQLGRHRLRLNDCQRRRLAVKGKALGRKLLSEVAGIVTPDTILRWYRRLVDNTPHASRLSCEASFVCSQRHSRTSLRATRLKYRSFGQSGFIDRSRTR